MKLEALLVRAAELEGEHATLVEALETKLTSWSEKSWETQVRYDEGAQHHAERQRLETKISRIGQERDAMYREIHEKQLELAALDMGEKHEQQMKLGSDQLAWSKRATLLAALGVLVGLISIGLTILWHGK